MIIRPIVSAIAKWPDLRKSRRLFQNVARHAASRRDVERVDGITAARGTGDLGIRREIRRDVGGGGHRVGGGFAFQSPRLFGAIDLPEIVDAGVHLLLRGGAYRL